MIKENLIIRNRKICICYLIFICIIGVFFYLFLQEQIDNNYDNYKNAEQINNASDFSKALEKSKKGYLPTCDIWHLADNVKSVLSTGNQTGEGWFLTAEMLEYMENGIQNIVCVQPFACLPNHVVGKGVIKTIRDMFPDANIVPVDYDPGASEVNQLNRIKLMLSTAQKNLKKEQNLRS